MLLAGGPHRQGRHTPDVREGSRLSMRGDERGTPHQDHLRPPERPHRQVRILEWRQSDANRNIDCVIDDIHPAIGRFECDANLGVRGEIPCEDPGHATLK